MNYRADYEKNKLNYTLPQDVPQMLKAKTNAELFSEVSRQHGEGVVGLCTEVKMKVPAPLRQDCSAHERALSEAPTLL